MTRNAQPLRNGRTGTRPQPRPSPGNGTAALQRIAPKVIMSIDLEEHWRIEAAAELNVGSRLASHYSSRLDEVTHWLLEQFQRAGVHATFFVVGQLALGHRALVRAIADQRHEVAIHGWDHCRIHRFTPSTFRDDVLRCKDTLEQLTGTRVVGYRAPTFSIVPQTAWAIDELVELGIEYDSSIYPIRHDRYGVPAAPRYPFRARGTRHEILELPPATLRLGGANLPAGGGGYFRLFPRFVMDQAVRQAKHGLPPVTALYFHPWEFDPGQSRLPLRRLNRFRTYVGLHRSRARFVHLLANGRFCRAADAAQWIRARWPAATLPAIDIAKTMQRPSGAENCTPSSSPTNGSAADAARVLEPVSANAARPQALRSHR